MPTSKVDNNGIIKRNDGSTINGVANYSESGGTIVKDDTRNNGRDFVKTSFESNIRAEIKNYYSTVPATVDEPKRQNARGDGYGVIKSSFGHNEGEEIKSYRSLEIEEQPPTRITSKQNSGRISSTQQRSYTSTEATSARGDGYGVIKSSFGHNEGEEIKSYRSSEIDEQPPTRITSKQNSGRISSTQQRFYTSTEATSGSFKLSGAAAPATYISTTNNLIKDDTKGNGREFIKGSLESNIKESLIKSKGIELDRKKIAITETTKSLTKLEKSNSLKGSTTLSEAKTHEISEKSKGKKAKGLIKTAGSYAYQEVINSAANGGKDGSLSDRTSGQSIKYIVKSPRYARNVQKGLSVTVANSRYTSKIYKDVRSGTLTGKEAALMTLKRGGVSFKDVGKTASLSLGKTIEEFYGSDDLGIEAIRKPKDVIVNTNKALKITSRAVKSVKQVPLKTKRTLKSIQKASRRTKQAVQYATRGIRAIGKALTNPVALKTLAIGASIVAVLIVAMAGISTTSALFSSFTYSSSDDVLSDTYAYITEHDTDLGVEIQGITSNPKWSHIDKFHIRAFAPQTDPIPIISYLTVRYEDFKLDDEIKNEIDRIYSEMYELTYHEWIQTIKHRQRRTHSDGSTYYRTWYEYIHHLDVDLKTIPWQTYVTTNKDELFKKEDDYAQYQTYNGVGGTTLRAELGFPFLGKSVYVSSRYGYRIDPINKDKDFHDGIDIPMPSGTPINATMSGKAEVGHNSGYGNYVTIISGKRQTLYAHCATIEVSDGQLIKKGDIIATVGSTGKSTGAHLHLEFKKNGKKLNPFFYIEREQFAAGVSGGFAGAAATDEQFGAIILEAEKYLGFPYVWGGKTPSTSFDCSGFVCWVYSQSGIKSISTDAQGLYNSSAPVTEDELKPGDLIFFQGTYDTTKDVTHVAIYVGDGMMLHAGNPIGYTTYNTAYWNSHFYGYGRLN